jgi:hypothetical protein
MKDPHPELSSFALRRTTVEGRPAADPSLVAYGRVPEHRILPLIERFAAMLAQLPLFADTFAPI